MLLDTPSPQSYSALIRLEESQVTVQLPLVSNVMQLRDDGGYEREEEGGGGGRRRRREEEGGGRRKEEGGGIGLKSPK
jgi:hypothetical protein